VRLCRVIEQGILLLAKVFIPEINDKVYCPLIAPDVDCQQMTEKIGRFCIGVILLSLHEKLAQESDEAAEILV
jgi:hypothetical protein